MEFWVNWRTKTTHLSRDCHQLVRIPEGMAWLEHQEGELVELVDVPRKYCTWCVNRLILACGDAGFDLEPEDRPPAERADFYDESGRRIRSDRPVKA